MFSDFDEPVHLRRAQPKRQNLWRQPAAGSGYPKAHRRLPGDGRLRFCRAISGATRQLRSHTATPAALLASLALLWLCAHAEAKPLPATTTPIQHLIVVVGENLNFDNLFGVYEPKSGIAIDNILSEEIVNRDGSPGPNFARAA